MSNTDALDEVIRDLEAEMASLESVIAKLPEEFWERRTHADGWAVRDQVAHLAELDYKSALAITDEAAFLEDARKGREGPRREGPPQYMLEAREKSPQEILRWWQESSANLVKVAKTVDPGRRMPWYGPPMSPVSFITARLMECWSHGLDVMDVVDVQRAPSTRLKHVAFLGVRTRNYSYVTRGLEPSAEPIRIELFAPDGETWLFGEPAADQVVRGPALDFCQVVTQRRNVADTHLEVVGDAAKEWMQYAQAFAGPPGAGRKPGQFEKNPMSWLHPD